MAQNMSFSLLTSVSKQIPNINNRLWGQLHSARQNIRSTDRI